MKNLHLNELYQPRFVRQINRKEKLTNRKNPDNNFLKNKLLTTNLG